MWAFLVVMVWFVAACLASLLVGRLARARDLPAARHLRELQAASLTPMRPDHHEPGAPLVEDWSATYA